MQIFMVSIIAASLAICWVTATNLIRVPCEKWKKFANLCDMILRIVQVDELALQYNGIRHRGLNGRFQTAINLSIDLNRSFFCSD